jgi:branched-subunit amino acid ABC-type transport system permease component
LEQIIANTVISAARYVLTAFGLSVIYRTTGCLDFAQGAMYAAGAYLSYVLAQVGVPLTLAIPMAGLCSAALGGLIECGIYRKLRQRHGGALAVLLASLGILIIVENVLVLVFGDLTYSLRPGVVPAGWACLGARVTVYQVILICAAIALAVAYASALVTTRAGLTLAAVANDSELAAVAGIPVRRVNLGAAMVGSGLSGLAGGLISLEVDMQPAVGGDALLIAVLVTMTGGPGRVVGTVAASMIFAGIDNLSAAYGAYLWRQTIAFGALIVFLIARRTTQVIPACRKGGA